MTTLLISGHRQLSGSPGLGKVQNQTNPETPNLQKVSGVA